MKKLISKLCIAVMILSLCFGLPINSIYANTYLTSQTLEVNEQNVQYYAYNAKDDGYSIDRSDVIIPSYFIFAGEKTANQAQTLLDELGMIDHIQSIAGKIYIINPIESNYTEKDLDAFIELVNQDGMVSNVKVIGIDEGATFVNNYVSQSCYFIAGMMVYGGDMNEGLTYHVPVPTYLSQSSEVAITYYKQANQTDSSVSSDTHTTYKSSKNEFQNVVVSQQQESLGEAFQNAWTTVFSKNYRQHNEKTECYMSNVKVHTEPYLFINMTDFDALHVNYYPHHNESLNGEGQYTWFEYIPQSTLTMEKGTVPLIVTLHGNGNDARIQGDTSGWVELASEENLMVVAPEWQDVVLDSSTHQPGPNYFGCDGLEGDKLVEWIDMLKEKYPQIDASRIYITGLSAGGSASSLYGAKYNKVFAGVGAVSAPGVDKKELTEIASQYQGNDVPYMYLCGDHDFFGMIPVDLSSQNSFEVAPGVHIQTVDENADMFPFIQAYQKINRLSVSDHYDLSFNEYYGIALDNQKWIQLGEKETLEGTLSNEKGVIMKLAAIKDQAHWNYKPEARYMWDFFKNYQRNTETGELIYLQNKKEEKPNEAAQQVVNQKVESVQTGDQAQIILPVSGMIIAGLYAIYYKKRETE